MFDTGRAGSGDARKSGTIKYYRGRLRNANKSPEEYFETHTEGIVVLKCGCIHDTEEQDYTCNWHRTLGK